MRLCVRSKANDACGAETYEVLGSESHPAGHASLFQLDTSALIYLEAELMRFTPGGCTKQYIVTDSAGSVQGLYPASVIHKAVAPSHALNGYMYLPDKHL